MLGFSAGHRVRERERRRDRLLAASATRARDGHPLRGRRGGGHAGDAEATGLLKAKGLATGCALVTDGRFSARLRLSIGHVSPSGSGGAIALVEPGDEIRVDIPDATIELVVGDRELARGREPWRPRRVRLGWPRQRGSGSNRKALRAYRASRLGRFGAVGRGIDSDSARRGSAVPIAAALGFAVRPMVRGAVSGLSIFVRQLSAFRALLKTNDASPVVPRRTHGRVVISTQGRRGSRSASNARCDICGETRRPTLSR